MNVWTTFNFNIPHSYSTPFWIKHISVMTWATETSAAMEVRRIELLESTALRKKGDDLRVSTPPALCVRRRVPV